MPTNLDPRIGTDAQSERIDRLIFDSLVELDAQSHSSRRSGGDHGNNPTRSRTSFICGSGVKFHDGRALTSADVKYTFDSIMDGRVHEPQERALPDRQVD